MSELLGSRDKENPLGKLKVLATFKKDSRMQIFGGKVMSGKVARGAMGDVIRKWCGRGLGQDWPAPEQ